MIGKNIINLRKNILNNRLERILILAKTDFATRYYGSVLGLLWAFINPFSKLIVYFLVFSLVIFKQKELDFVLYLFSGIIVWTFFSQTTKIGLRAMNTKRYLLENIKINKIDIFISHTISSFIGFLFNLFSYFVILLFFDIHLSFSFLWLPVLLITLFIFSLSVTIILSVIFIRFKDLDHIWDIALLAGFWSMPIIWDQAYVLNEYRFMLFLNPVTGVLINFRSAALYGTPLDYSIVAYDFIFSLVILFFSVYLLKNHSQKAAEIK